MSTEVETVKAVEWVLEGAGRLGRNVAQLPSPAAGEILVATMMGAISPGAERVLLHGTSPLVGEGGYPYQPGYLNVVRILDAPDRTLVGERGIAILGHRDFALVPYAKFVRIPSNVTDENAMLGVLAADARNAIEIASVGPKDRSLVIGGGILGVLTAWELCHRTNEEVRIVERDPARRELIQAIRFPRNVVRDAEPGNAKWHFVFDCANGSDAFDLAQQVARPGASIVLVADGSHEKYSLSPQFFAKGLYLGKTDANPDLRSFLAEWFSRHEDRESLLDVAFRDEIRFTAYPQAYLEALLGPPERRRGLLPRVRYD
ncbi:MAG: hypothetical protein KC591_18260 [Gemmatimonadetes bacterium]|nr:hypothetical protein [Gemmatimonadota bacterium]